MKQAEVKGKVDSFMSEETGKKRREQGALENDNF